MDLRVTELKKRIQYHRECKLEERASEIHKHLRHELQYWTNKKAIKDGVLSDSSISSDEDIEKHIIQWMNKTGVTTKIKNSVYLHDRQAQWNTFLPKSGLSCSLRLPLVKEPVEIIDAARRQWDTRLRYELRSVAAKQKRKLVQVREYLDSKEVEYLIRFVYTSEDMLETLVSILNPNCAGTFSRIIGWGLIKVQLKTPSLTFFRQKYEALSPNSRQVGLDDTVLGLEWFKTERIQTGDGISSAASPTFIPTLRKYARTGVPASVRPQLWSRIMGVEVTAKDHHYFESLLTQVQQWDLITDDLTRFDVQDAADDDEFFVFEELLDEIMLAFTRDKEVPHLCSIFPSTAVLRSVPPKSSSSSPKHSDTHSSLFDKKKHGAKQRIECVPPNCIIPFHRQVMFAAPLCYLFAKSEDCYFLFRALYCRYFSRLHIISSQPDTIIFLCKTFENLLQVRAPEAFYHAANLGCHPLSVVFPWIFSAFAGWLDVDQVLLLWDRIIAFDSLEPVAILAAAIFVFRSKSVLTAKTPLEIQDIFREMYNLKVVPLLQDFLFA